MTSLSFDVPSFASQIRSDSIRQALAMVKDNKKACDCCRRIRHGNAFDERGTTCRQCVRASQKVMPSCHPMLLAKWGPA